MKFYCLIFLIVLHLAKCDNVASFFGKSHTNNWAVLVCTSRFWFNYRHIANILSIYRTVKRFGIPDSQIIVMLADDVACNARNKFPATVFNNKNQAINLYGEEIEVDYRGYEVTVENFVRVLTDRHSDDVPQSKRLMTDENSNILVYMTGHGGEDFLKFQDSEEITSIELADTFNQMFEMKRYNEILFMIDTCKANSMFSYFYSPNIIAMGSSERGQNSYSHHLDEDLGVAVIDRWTYFTLEYLESLNRSSMATLQQLTRYWNPNLILSNPGVRTDLFVNRPYENVHVMDFFGNVQETLLVADLMEGSHVPLNRSFIKAQPKLKDYVADIYEANLAKPKELERKYLTINIKRRTNKSYLYEKVLLVLGFMFLLFLSLKEVLN
ncbi:hypothetical protein ROZALSC1DRAFT_29499 [Rozella allomycis CSF55]|uniref:Peptidase C13, legumain domain-containing protein n=1 Tax=Rozella allomycis (strain CSF55) TaxID=988480 RepID=A0A075AUF7_ROZAC|nr:Peptidase C13, legumain domain-containing protein [Rozella allomycis CSF55]RKP18847.1 hypothetical protein ROZALSC1DRAFT_29499 [Rozella allomycis CSF55]|eukprot:EPZ33795.1 Peptidase C13, legumain domain-containing protein [Rozella allomycis CSF55]